MKLITWTESLSTGILEIDEQHKKLISLLNRASEMIDSGKPKEYLISGIKEIIKFTMIHFSTEEKMFKVSKYTHTKKHTLEHQKMIQKANTFLNEFNNNNLLITDTTIGFFMDWIVNHILVFDMAYSKPLKAAGYK